MWKFVRFGLFVTGKGERTFFPAFLRSLTESGHCTFDVVRQVPQLSPRTSGKHELKIVGTSRHLPTRDEELGLFARGYLDRYPDAFVLLVDDLEHDRRSVRVDVFARYRNALDGMLGERGWRAGVHFLVNMLEAYYFADAAAVNAVLGTKLVDHTGDVEEIRHPKNDLKALSPGFDEVRHGAEIVRRLDVPHVLSRPETCGSLRAMFAWCSAALAEDAGARFRFADGTYDEVTRPQVRRLAENLARRGGEPTG